MSKSILLRSALLAVVLCALPTVLLAQDGGTRSVFAQGAGIRAQAMGGAFTAVSDDASASLWNPGGLGIVARREIQLSRTTLYGLDITEDYASAVLPSWRWGTAALSFRRFGVSGIEGRDDRNLVTDPDLSDGETELGVAYGRRLGAGWGLGGSVKFRRQSLGDASASAVGGDLGLVLRPGVAAGTSIAWLQRLALGASMINALEPSLRLDQESVKDPTTLRLGVAYEQPMGPGRGLHGRGGLRTVARYGFETPRRDRAARPPAARTARRRLERWPHGRNRSSLARSVRGLRDGRRGTRYGASARSLDGVRPDHPGKPACVRPPSGRGTASARGSRPTPSARKIAFASSSRRRGKRAWPAVGMRAWSSWPRSPRSAPRMPPPPSCRASAGVTRRG